MSFKKTRVSIDVSECNDRFADKKPTIVGRNKVTCCMTISPCTVDHSRCFLGVNVSQEEFVQTPLKKKIEEAIEIVSIS